MCTDEQKRNLIFNFVIGMLTFLVTTIFYVMAMDILLKMGSMVGVKTVWDLVEVMNDTDSTVACLRECKIRLNRTDMCRNLYAEPSLKREECGANFDFSEYIESNFMRLEDFDTKMKTLTSKIESLKREIVSLKNGGMPLQISYETNCCDGFAYFTLRRCKVCCKEDQTPVCVDEIFRPTCNCYQE